MNPSIGFSRRIRPTPFEPRVHENGAKSFTVYNQMLLATCFQSFEEDYWHLREHVQLWDVACERQVEVRGPDALKLIELTTPRDVSKCQIGQCIYAPLCDEHGRIVNDPLILRLATDRFWVSIADSGVFLWLSGLATGLGLDVQVLDTDIGPCALQGPKADAVLQSILDIDVSTIGFFRFIEVPIAGTSVVVARSGWSGQGGFEIYLQEPTMGLALWDEIWRHGEAHNIRAGCPNVIERIESGLLSYGSDIVFADNIFECGLDRFLKLGKPAQYLSREALDRVACVGINRKLVRLEISGGPVPAMRATWPVLSADSTVGLVSSVAWSPRFEVNVALATVALEHCGVDTVLTVQTDSDAEPRVAKVVTDWPN